MWIPARDFVEDVIHVLVTASLWLQMLWTTPYMFGAWNGLEAGKNTTAIYAPRITIGNSIVERRNLQQQQQQLQQWATMNHR
jgi:hypothetical protein